MAEENQKIQFTVEGMKRLQDELEERKTVISGQIAEQLKEARAQGDLSENSEYDEAKDAQAKNEARIMEIEEILKNAEVIDESEISKTKISLGSKVTLRDEETKDEIQYEIVNAKDADIFSNRISQDSPVGKAIIGKKKGQVIEVTTVAGAFKYKIIKIGD
ncbi:MAG: transcription elongation factor GreA [Clostridiales bacterium]|nr:transcription elongation factor GreA [Clostridiales bacterium]MBR4819135.1 transcription elongation factor GreA [Clostridiales bacterium]MBR5039583.1 transcription elongation factor GreA [Clostridiales bacterium]MBR5057408.1 transcription elongation factor GreA [Clostridiales bacterium]